MDYYQLSASAFADKIQVPRSSISHLLSGRNKPSLDFVLKVVKEFNEVELYWLLNGKGTFPNASEVPEQHVQLEKRSPSITDKSSGKQAEFPIELDKELEKIVFFYSDGSFKEYRK